MASSIADVSDTAFWVAHYRGIEGKRRDALFRDPLATRLAGEHGQKIAREMPGAPMTAWAVAIRTRLIDEYIRQAIANGVDTILNLGAGLDTRPYRMDLASDVRWIEADFPKVIEFKEAKLAGDEPHCQLQRVKVDLSDAQQRRALLAEVDAGAKKLLVLTEGVIPYLDPQEVAALADELHGMKTVRYWIVDYFAPAMLAMRRPIRRRMANAPFKFFPEDWFGFFVQHGWRCAQMRYLPEYATEIGRPLRLPPLMAAVATVRMLFASKGKRAIFRKFAGYALLEPAAQSAA
jgi:methyltransferase (TIGR00027 family)